MTHPTITHPTVELDATTSPGDCDSCGTPIDDGNQIEVDDELLCTDCASFCNDCHTWHVDGIDCGCPRCADCNTRMAPDNQIRVDDVIVCRDCGSYCDDCCTWNRSSNDCDCPTCERCDARIADQNVIYADDLSVCADCAWRCEGCNTWRLEGNDCPCDSLDGMVHHCDYLPLLAFHGDGPLYLGMELEIGIAEELQYDCARLCTQTLDGLAWLKRDGSVEGFELVTHPMSYQWAITKFPWHLLPALAEKGADRHCPSAGLHVHLSRAGFAGPAHIYRWMKLIHRNRPEVIGLARRDSTSYAPFTDDARRDTGRLAKGKAWSGKYAAINTCHEDTFELRVFASSLEVQHVQAVLGFADASVEYTRHLSVADIARRDGWGWSAFADWVAQHDTYAPLTREIGVA
ncbi:hypothetical protein [Actinocatenispora rupis]|uniref:Amidoligase enzyme n=1 Tax=Actinocatenispora rupis TaxID=519421 RepID=A0A8J3N8L1_9ACTN|nr:hypothetical protein [Actinocatenispora rupis]GID10206.1 hypothetical protein Aru02nite_10950 [Actinocatenispora rupis]